MFSFHLSFEIFECYTDLIRLSFQHLLGRAATLAVAGREFFTTGTMVKSLACSMQGSVGHRVGHSRPKKPLRLQADERDEEAFEVCRKMSRDLLDQLSVFGAN